MIILYYNHKLYVYNQSIHIIRNDYCKERRPPLSIIEMKHLYYYGWIKNTRDRRGVGWINLELGLPSIFQIDFSYIKTIKMWISLNIDTMKD
jgi:hypothetical protein